jgi:hypothetical protein
MRFAFAMTKAHDIPDTPRFLLQKKMFWAIYIALSLVADFTLSLTWSLILSIPLLFVSWWLAYRTGWFD